MMVSMTKSASKNYMSHGLNKRSRPEVHRFSHQDDQLSSAYTAGGWERQLLLYGLTTPRLTAMQLAGNK